MMPGNPIKFVSAVAGLCAMFYCAFLAACGAGPDFNAGRDEETKPSEQDFLGEWTPKGGFPGRNAAKPTVLTFSADGRFAAVNYPGKALGMFETPDRLIDGAGEWSLTQYRESWVIQIKWLNIAGTPIDYRQMLDVLNDTSPYVLKYYIGDPDSGEALVFKPAKNPNGARLPGHGLWEEGRRDRKKRQSG